jgi:cytochrome P450
MTSFIFLSLLISYVYREVGRQNLVATMLDLFIAGSETTSTTLTWSVLYMARHPDIQQRVQVGSLLQSLI